MIKLLLLNKYSLLMLIIGFGFYNNCKSQNLIRNGSFESYNTPISWNLWGGDFIGYYSSPPDTIMIDWKQYSSPDFFISACTHTYSGVPINLFGNSYAKEGYNYVGFIAYVRGSYIKEYIFQKLSQPLQAGKIYCLNFFVSKADNLPYSIKSIGALFSNSIQPVVNGYQINAVPQVVNTNGFISDTTLWTEIQGCFTANGGEQYITIGNFIPNANTDTLNVGSNNQLANGETESYYYIDDITLIDQTTVGTIELHNNNSIEVYPNPASNLLQVNVPREYTNCEAGIYNAIGELVLSKQITSNHSSINIENLKSGIYYCQILVNGKPIKNDKIVIIK